jgi:hypothetical protein
MRLQSGFKRISQLFATILLVATLCAPTVSTSPRAFAQDPDPIPGYLSQVDLVRLTSVAADLVNLYGPRHADYNRHYIDDVCTLSSTVYPQSNMEMASDYVKSLFEAMGYTVTMEEVGLGGGTWTGHNVVATKIGSDYPNTFIEVGAHLDSQPTTPGAGDNASGSTAVIELAHVLKDYPSRYSIRFILFVGHEHGGYNEGSMYHLDQVMARGEGIKAGLVMDGIGWSEIEPDNMNVVWFNDAESERIADLFNTVRTEYNIDIGWRKTTSSYSDNQSYWDHGFTAVLSIGGTPYGAPGYHGCGDTMDVLDMQNIYKTTQQNLAVLMKLDEEDMPTPPEGKIQAVSATASSEHYPAMNAFDGNYDNFWHVTQADSVFPKWLQADLGSSKTVGTVETDYGPYSGNIATDFEIWLSDDPTFASYTVAAHITGNTESHVIVAFATPVTGRYLRYVVNAVNEGGDEHGWWSAAMYEMDIWEPGYGPTPSCEEVQVVSATASSEHNPAMNAFDGNYDNFWHVTEADSVFPKWLQADLGSSQDVGTVETDYGPYSGNIATDFEIWVSDDPSFASYTVAAHVTGNTESHVIVPFATPVAGRYLRYVVNAVNEAGDEHGWWSACMYEMDIWEPDCGPTPSNRPPQASDQSVTTAQDTPIAITLVASDLDGDDLTYAVVTGPTHGTLTGTAPDLTYTPEAGYIGPDSLTFKANDGIADSNVATVNISVTPPPPLPVVAAVASSAWGVSDTEGKYPMMAFDGQVDTYWHIAEDNFGYADKWLQADLGLPKTIDQIVLDYGTGGTGGETIANDFEIWVGDDPTFAPGSYIVAATVTGNTDQVVTLTFDPPVTGRWVRYIVSEVTGPNWWDFTMAEMWIYGSDLAITDVKLTAVGATASSEQAPRAPAVNAFDGRYDNFWHVNSTDTFPKWVQADLGSPQTLDRVVAFYYGGYAMVEDGNKATDFEIWVGNDSTFAAGTYAVATSVTGNDSYIVQVSFAPVTGRYMRYLVTAIKGTDPTHYWNANMYEMEIWNSYQPTAIELASFTAEASAEGVALAWETGTELDNAGFNLYRATAEDGPYTKINDALFAAQGDAVAGASYSFVDTPGYGTFYYQLEDVDYYGVSTLHGPVEATVARPFRRPLRRPRLPEF